MNPLTDNGLEVGERIDVDVVQLHAHVQAGHQVARMARARAGDQRARGHDIALLHAEGRHPGVGRFEPASVVDRDEEVAGHRAGERDRAAARAPATGVPAAAAMSMPRCPDPNGEAGGSNPLITGPVTGHVHGPAADAGAAAPGISHGDEDEHGSRRVSAWADPSEASSAAAVTHVTLERRIVRAYSTSVSCPLSPPTAFVWIWQTRDSVTPRISPISASVSPSK